MDTKFVNSSASTIGRNVSRIGFGIKKAILDSSAEPFDKLRTGPAEVQFFYMSSRMQSRGHYERPLELTLFIVLF
ncbi:hypothetical protein [Aquimarina atlantica]|uniref:hypothetical protein n=1 Tax=Aquimarina atlantica TaxID=1317122 RepID=UPI00103E8CC1|nr:hypothetical protein [Aquimarina atlantica]